MRYILTALIFIAIFNVFPEYAAAQQNPRETIRSLNFQSGSHQIGDNLASINISGKFKFLSANDAKTFLTKVWGNPPQAVTGTLGLIVPTDVSPLTTEGWAVVVRYDPSGYVSDDEAGKIDYDTLLKDMQSSSEEANQERVKAGYPAIHLLGWAKKPQYDVFEKKLLWAKRLKFGDDENETLNYETRVLGRKGVLILNTVGSMDQFSSIDKNVDGILQMVTFNTGSKYSEFDPSIDKSAAYGLAGLVAGGVLVKSGFFKLLLVGLLASKKIVALVVFGAFAGAIGFVKSLFGHKVSKSTSQE